MPHRLFDLEQSIPGWIRPTWRGALFTFGIGTGTVGKLFVLFLLATLVFMVGVAQGTVLFFTLLAVTIAAGAVGGTIHGLLWRAEEWGRIGTWLRWTLAILGYIITFGYLAPAGPFHPRDYAFFPVAAVLAAVGAGCLILLDARRPGRLSPGRHRRQEARSRMFASADRARTRQQARMAETVLINRGAELPGTEPNRGIECHSLSM